MDARLARLALLPAAGLWRAGTRARDGAYARGWLRQDVLPLPAIGVGNLTVGDSGKGPVLVWMARHLGAQDRAPGVLLRGDSQWRVAAFEHAAPHVPVTVERDLVQGAARLAAGGCRMLLAECRVPTRDLRFDAVVAVVGAETSRAVRWPLPAGPWREPWAALGAADLVVVTRKRAPAEAAAALAREIEQAADVHVAIAQLGVRHLEGLVSGTEHPATLLANRRVVAASGSADPDGFISQVKATGAAVQVARWEAEGEMRDSDVAWLAHAARRADHVVLSEGDAVKVRDRWPARVAEPLVAIVGVTWERGVEHAVALLDRVGPPQAR